MEISKRKLNKNNFDQRVDQLFQAGRQLVDGVSGTRPGVRRRTSFSEFSRRNVKSVGHWVNNKMDTLFEDNDEEWDNEETHRRDRELKSFRHKEKDFEKISSTSKRPLEAISLRAKDNINNDQKKLPSSGFLKSDTWEDDEFFQINKWQRASEEIVESKSDERLNQNRNKKVRNFPRSRRSRI